MRPLGLEGTASASPQPEDAELVARTLAGDAAAFELLVRRHYGGAYAVALAVLGVRADAEDACHDGFVQAAAHLGECRHPGRFGAWLRTIVRNQARNAMAKQSVRRAEPLEEWTAAGDADAHRTVERAELARRLETALAVLAPTQREVLLLHDLEDWPHEEIARSLGISVVMSRQHLFQARRRLRTALSGVRLEDTHDT